MALRQSSRSLPLLAALAALVACGDAAKPPVAPAPPVPSVAAAGPAIVALPPGVPDSPAGQQLAWVLSAFGRPPTEADVTSRLTPDFTAQVPAARVIALFTQVGAQLSPLAL